MNRMIEMTFEFLQSLAEALLGETHVNQKLVVKPVHVVVLSKK